MKERPHACGRRTGAEWLPGGLFGNTADAWVRDRDRSFKSNLHRFSDDVTIKPMLRVSSLARLLAGSTATYTF
jgi:hypothetical protein